MQWASNILWCIARQSFIISIPTGGFVSASSSSFFSLILLMRCQKSENSAAASSRKGITSWKFSQILKSVQLKCIRRESIHLEFLKSAPDQRSSCSSESKLSMCRLGGMLALLWRNSNWPEIQIHLILIPKSLDARGLIGVKACILKPRTFVSWTPHKEHTESAIRKDHLAPCRFKCWTNLYSIGISQPLAQLQCHYNVEIPRVSLHLARLKWDFRTDRCNGNACHVIHVMY